MSFAWKVHFNSVPEMLHCLGEAPASVSVSPSRISSYAAGKRSISTPSSNLSPLR